jgi:hypothetical protein
LKRARETKNKRKGGKEEKQTSEKKGREREKREREREKTLSSFLTEHEVLRNPLETF